MNRTSLRTIIVLSGALVLGPVARVAASPATDPRTIRLEEQRSTLTRAGARLAIDTVLERARVSHAGATVALVDDGGNLMALERVDGTFAAGALISYGKARTAALFKKPTSFFERLIRDGRTPMVALDDFTPLQGGVPIIVKGVLVGAIGVSGASSAQQDEEFAIAGANAVLKALGAQPLTAAAVAAPASTASPQYYTSVGGREQKLAPGDVHVVPAGVPHWFRDVRGPLTDHVVKTH